MPILYTFTLIHQLIGYLCKFSFQICEKLTTEFNNTAKTIIQGTSTKNQNHYYTTYPQNKPMFSNISNVKLFIK